MARTGSFAKGTLFIGTRDGLFQAKPQASTFKAQLIGLQGKGELTTVCQDLKEPRLLLIGTMNLGVYRTEDGGKLWRESNGGLPYREIWATAQHPRTGEVYVGTSPSAVFRSQDGGKRWTELAPLRDLPDYPRWTYSGTSPVSHVRQIALHFGNPSLIFGAIEEGGVVRSMDGGRTWSSLHQGLHTDVHCVLPMTDNPRTLICTTGQGMFHSRNAGDSFTPVGRAPEFSYFTSIVSHVSRPNVLFTAAAEVPPAQWQRPQGANGAIFRSEDQGLSWHKVAQGFTEPMSAAPRALAFHPDEPECLVVGWQDGTVWLTENSGASFRKIVQGLPAITSVAISPH
jgi:photosystem II stability/assembly factor-like uncharacterized protein